MGKTGLMLHAACSLACAIIVGVFACNNSPSGFPFSGPGCASPYYSNECWNCLDRYCNAGCAVSDCKSYFECVCASEAGDDSNCIHDPSCVACLHGIDNGRGLADCFACSSQCFPMDGGDAGGGDDADGS
jgi:hypothetical protein